jgi:BolA family transcriptional regulator, general stress-responsive regulator
MNSLIEEISNRLQSISPSILDVTDDSALHAGHHGNEGGGHYTVDITSSHFIGKSQIMRHRIIYQILADLIPIKIHALSISAHAPDEH